MLDAIAVLEFVKSKGPIQVSDIQREFSCEDKPARNAIDVLRARNEPIWYDDEKGFWWSDDQEPSGEPHMQWKRKAP